MDSCFSERHLCQSEHHEPGSHISLSMLMTFQYIHPFHICLVDNPLSVLNFARLPRLKYLHISHCSVPVENVHFPG